MTIFVVLGAPVPAEVHDVVRLKEAEAAGVVGPNADLGRRACLQLMSSVSMLADDLASSVSMLADHLAVVQTPLLPSGLYSVLRERGVTR